MKCDFQTSGLMSKAELKLSATFLEPYRKHLALQLKETDYAHNEASIQLPFDSESSERILELAKTFKSKSLEYIVVIGIGGSNLGTQAISDALDPKTMILYLDTVSSYAFTEIVSILKICESKEEFLLVSISKSGNTIETIANTETLLATLRKPFGNVFDRLVVITDKDSHYWNSATSQNIPCLEVPKLVGGRYSVFSAVGLFPLAVAGVDVKKLLQGAQDAAKDSTNKSTHTNNALTFAAHSFAHYTKGHTIHNSFFFAPELESLGKWYRQLMGESLGKDGKGLTPIVSIGSADLHSMAQLYFDGANNVITNIITAPTQRTVRVPKKLIFPRLVENIAGKSFRSIMQAISNGTKTTYKKLKRPLVTIELEKLDAYELGYYMQTRMIEIMYLAQLLDVNAFDQPAVASYKKETQALLKN